jgi:hypothetical protein
VYDFIMMGAIGVATFSRAEHLNNCIESIVRAKGSRDIPLLVLHQIGDPEVKQILTKWRPHIQLLIELESKEKSALKNINFNSILLRNIALDVMALDWYLGIEEDVVIGGDSVAFIEHMMSKYSKKRAFRGVNLGSNLPSGAYGTTQYSKMRYGMQGQASAITQRTWKRFNVDQLNRNSSWIGLDSMMENYLKSGFMCTPLLSRYLDRGWGGTHSPRDPQHDYYRKLEESFVDLPENIPLKYLENKIRIPWRKDALLYSPRFTLIQVVKNFIRYHYHTTLRRFVLNLNAQIKDLSRP